MSPSGAVVCLSGGLDSTTLLFAMLREFEQVRAIAFDYGQRHRCELRAAHLVAQAAGVPLITVEMPQLGTLFSGSALTDTTVDVPHGHYSDESMKQTVVPNRNMIFLSIAAGYAISQRARVVAFGGHSGDHTIYPDCRPEFVSALKEAIRIADWHSVELIAPFANLSKSEICKLGKGLHVPFSLTWSCYEGAEHHCGKCGTCVERIEAFQLAEIPDPTVYRS